MRRLLLPLLLCASLTRALPATPPDDRLVVMISVDGLAQYYFDDPKAEMPTIRHLAAEGARAKMLKASMPTVTWPNHTTLVTGVTPAKHGVIGNSYWDRAAGKVVPLLPDPFLNKDEIVKVPTVYDLAKKAGLKTAAIVWPASRGAATLDWTVPDVMTNALWQQYGTPALLAECKQAGLPIDKQEEYCKTGQGRARDLMYVQMLNSVIRNHRPNLALLHLVELDHVEHAHGPQCPEAYDTVKFEDERVREVWEEMERDFPGKATLFVVSDHGFFPYQQTIQPNVLLRKDGYLQAEGSKITSRSVVNVTQGGSTYLYILDDANREAIRDRLQQQFKQTEGVGLVLVPSEYPLHGLPDPKQDPHAPDLVVSAKSGYSFSDSLAGDLLISPKSEEVKGTHGYDSNEPGMHATLVACGAGIKPGVQVGIVPNTSVAPTVAAVLGFPMPNTDGPAIAEILTK